MTTLDWLGLDREIEEPELIILTPFQRALLQVDELRGQKTEDIEHEEL